MGASKTNQYAEKTKNIAKIAFAISHPARVHIIEKIREYGFIRNADLMPLLSLSVSTIHDHVIKLKNADIIEIEFHPNEYHLRLNPKNLSYLVNFLHCEA